MTVNKSPTVPMDWLKGKSLAFQFSDMKCGCENYSCSRKKNNPLTIAILHDPIKFGRTNSPALRLSSAVAPNGNAAPVSSRTCPP